MSDFIQVTVATNSQENAFQIAEALTTQRLAASVWVSGSITSHYWWQGAVQRAEEWVCTAKTRREHYSEVERTIKSIHPYEVPGILATPILAGSQPYLEWITRETQAVRDTARDQGSQKEALLRALGEAHERLIAVATAAHERGVRQREGIWGPREVLAHIAGWEANALVRLPKIIAGEPPLHYDDDAINAIVITLLGDQTFESVRDLLRKTYQQDIEMLKGQEESIFVPGHSVYERIQAAIRHIDEHAQVLARQR